MQVLEASDGAKAAGWPAFHKSTVHTSPLMYDLDFDGVQDILLATYGGEILAFRDNVRRGACLLACRYLILYSQLGTIASSFATLTKQPAVRG